MFIPDAVVIRGSSQAEILVSLLSDVCDRQTHRRAGVSGAKKAWMVMEGDAGLPAWLGSVGVARRFQSGG
jgi:hypothetical protein